VLEMARGLAYSLTDSRTVYIGSAVDWLANPIALGIAPSFLIAIAITVVGQIVLVRTVFGRYLVAIGTNEEAVRLAGVNPRPYKIAVFALMGLLSGLAALFQVSRLEAADPNAGVGMELQVIAAVVIGGTSLMGGRGSVVRTLFGVLIISVLDLRMEARTALLANSLAAANKELAYLALHDNLTKLSNRVLLEDRLTQAIRTAEREKHRFALMFMDLDGFKAVNDVYGHHVGDLLLIDVAQRIGARVRQQDTVARVGGDEFVVLAYVDDPEDAGTLANALLEVVREPFMAGGHELRVSTSIGIAIYPGDGGNQHDLLTNADAAMYHAKGLGRNAYSFFEPSMNADVHQQLQLVQDLRRAVERHELVLHYQPKFNAPNGPIMGVEALVRWQHPQRGLVPADEFIPLAEKTGLIVPLGAWVLDEACRQMAQWQREGHSGWSVAVNLSDSVRDTLARHALDPRSLTLEITESTAMRDVDASLQILQRLDAMGVRISIDDFGTGYSSLLYLKRLPASELKIDRGFVRDLAHDTEDAAIVSAIVALGQTLNLRIVAEGVETAEQQAFLTRLGCHSLQGYLLGRPMTAESLSAAMA